MESIIFINSNLTGGSRTPHYGSMTPSHDGSRTPGQSGAWDPTITNTPARTNDFDQYNTEEGGSPGYPPQYAPTEGPFIPQTPSIMYGSEQSFGSCHSSPIESSTSNSSSNHESYIATPSSMNTEYINKSYDAYSTPSPRGYTPSK